MSSSDSIISTAIESFRIKKKFHLKWKIHDFVCKEVKAGEALPWTKFEFSYDDDIKFKGHLCLVGDNCEQRQCILHLTSLTLDNWKVWVELGFGDDMSGNYGAALNEVSHKAIWNLWSNETLCILSKYLSSNTIKLNCSITYVTYTEDKSLAATVVNDYDAAELFETKINSDVTFVVAGIELLAHKSILAKRSQVFAAMFEEDKSDKITLSDIDIEVLQELLRFIYTGEVAKVTADLLAASDKYNLPDLKTICENELSCKMSTDTVARTLVYADLYQVTSLKEHSINYIHDNLVAVTETEGWLKLVNNYSHLLAEIWK